MNIDELKIALKDRDSGRWEWDRIDCCLTGKDADLEPWGQQGIELIEVSEAGAKCLAHIGKTFVGDDVCLNLSPDIEDDEKAYERAREAYLDQATEVVCGCSVAGEWSGNDWWMSDSVEILVPLAETAAETADRIIAATEEALKPLEDELGLADEILDVLSGWSERSDNGEIQKCAAGIPGRGAAWIQE